MNKKTKAHCNECLGDRNHEILFTETTYWSHGESGDPSGSNKYEMLKCQGCDSIILRHTSEWSEDPEPSVYYYPPAIFRRQPHWLYDLGAEGILIRKLLNEIYGGLQNDMKMIATMGVRALMEHVMIDSVGDQGTFAKNLTEFAKKGFISDKQRDILTVVLEIGHATMHRAYEPSDKDLTTCIDIAETVIQSIYVHPEKAAELAKRVPKRKP